MCAANQPTINPVHEYLIIDFVVEFDLCLFSTLLADGNHVDHLLYDLYLFV